MKRKVIIAGLMGGVVLFAWTFVLNGVFGFKRSVDMKPIPDERQVYEVLKANFVKPGRYIANPELSPSGAFPGGEPVFSIHYSGLGHDSAGRLMPLQLVVFCLAPLIGAWMLSLTSRWVLASYRRKVLFFAAIGLLLAVYGDLMSFGIDGYPLADALLLAAYDIISWTLVGLVVAWRLQPEPDRR
jgi:hypothetical protein